MIGIKHLSVRPGQSPKSAAAQVAGYVQAERDEEKKTGYYSERGGAPSRWLGEGARRLGLSGSVDAEVFMELLQGHLPTGEDISDRGGRAAGRRMGTDLTISAPKSFSMLVAGADPETRADLLRLWDESVSAAASVIEKESTVARLGKGGATVEHTNCMVAATFRHEDARPVDGVADMDIHSHLIHLNMTQRSDGVWAARDLDFGQRNVLRMTADFAAKAVLAKGLQERGHAIRQTKDGFELAAITDPEIRLFSRRTTQIDDTLEERGLTRQSSTSDQRDATNLATRQDKLQLSQIEQAWDWRKRLREAGINIDKMIRAARDVLKRGPVTVADLSTDAVASATRHLGERESVFSKRMTRLEALKAGMGAVTLDTVDQAIADKAAGLIDVGGDKLTTREALYREQEILARAREGHGALGGLMSPSDAESFIADQEQRQGFEYNTGQRDALALALTTTDRVTGVRGAWGAGKTTSMKGLTKAAHDLGITTIGLAPTTRAASELKSAGTKDIRTIASWLMTKPEISTAGTPIRNDDRLIILDEAGMVSTEDMVRIVRKLDAEGGRLLLVGDQRQLPSVGAGTPFDQLMKTGAIRYAEIDEVQRQKDPRLLEMAQVWARGDAVAAVEIAKEHMRVASTINADYEAAGKEREAHPDPEPSEEIEGTPTAAMLALAEKTGMPDFDAASFKDVREWLDTHTDKWLGYESREKGGARGDKGPRIPREVRQQSIAREAAQTYLAKDREVRNDTIMMAATNKLRRMINTYVREGLKAKGEVAGGHEITVRALDKSQMTREAMARPESYIRKDGDPEIVVRLQEGRGKERHDVDYKVVGVHKGRVALEGPDGTIKSWNPAKASRPGVFTARDMPVAPGDEISFRDNVGRKGAPDRIDNGASGKVTGIDKRGIHVALDDGRKLFLDPTKNHVMDHGWAVTVHKSQGATRGGAIYAAESVGVEAIAQLAGVACTREKAHLEIITDDTENLGKAMSKWAERETAMAATKAQESPDLETLKTLRAEAAEELGKAGDLSRAREDAEWKQREEEGAVEHRRDRENQERREREEEQEWEIER